MQCIRFRDSFSPAAIVQWFRGIPVTDKLRTGHACVSTAHFP
jgi:hypothetical protein